MGNVYRMEYFDDQFKSLASRLARSLGLTIRQFLSDVRNFTTFKEKLREVFSLDSSLANYVEGMSPNDFKLFFNRPLIQEIIETNKGMDTEVFTEIQEDAPEIIIQEDKKVQRFFKAVFFDKIKKKLRRVIAKEVKVIRNGKVVLKYRDSKGRFVRRV